MFRGPAVLILLAILAACSGAPDPAAQPTSSSTVPPATPLPTASPAESPQSHGPAGLVNDLRAMGVDAEQAGEFAGDPVSTLGVLVCVEGEPVQVYVYGTAQEAAAVAGRIDPQDPSNFGTSIIEWAGEPKFWVRDRVLVLYLGTDADVTAALVSLLGEPFARGEGRPPLLGGEDC